MNIMPHSKAAIWRAVNNEEHGTRLVEIAQEHLRLIEKLPARPATVIVAAGADPLEVVREIIYARIEQLRVERDAIIQLYEGGSRT